MTVMKLIAFFALAISFVSAGGVSQAHAREEILSYDALVEVEPDGAFIVTEEITVRAEGFEIRRGIFRDFPTVQRLPSGLVHRTTFELLSVQRDGRDEPHHTEFITGGKRVYVGDANTFLRPDIYTYTLRYRSDHQMRFFETYDEVYWNATGNFWSFPIRRASATIRLPEGARVGNIASFIGSFGSTVSHATGRIVGPNEVRFETTKPLSARQGLTVAVGFDKGIIPDTSEAGMKPVLDNAGIFALLAGGVLTFGFMMINWARVGRDPPRGVIIPRFEPPEGMSAAEVSWVHFHGHKGGSAGRSFMAALVSLGTKNQLIIDEEGEKLTLRRTPEAGADPEAKPWNRHVKADASLPPDERALMRALFASSDTLVFDRANGKRLMRVTSAFQKAIQTDLSGTYFNRNTGYVVMGVVLAVLSVFAYLALFPSTEEMVVGVLFHAVGGLIVGFALSAAFARFTGRAPQISLPLAIFALVPSAAILAGLAYFFHLDPAGMFTTGWAIRATMVAAFLIGLTVTVFARLMLAPTENGQRIMDEIEGLKLYLSVAEAERMNMKDAPDFTVDLYEKMLPFAIGLGVEKPWSEALESHLDKIGPADQRRTYQPRFYHGRSFSPGTVAASTAAIASTIGTAYASSMPRSSGSSGGGGGGFSGGGGGGGGGGGW